MTDERDDNVMQPGVYDDDRLLAFALGLEEDPELIAAAAADARLAARLEAMRADVAQIGARVSAAVPSEPDESYTDLSGDRWSGLKEYFEAPAAAAPRRRSWWQVAAPVAAVLVIAVIVGIVAVQNGTQSATSESGSAEVARSEDGSGGSPQSLGEGATKTTGTDQTTTSSPTLREQFADQLDRFAVVVLARAREVSGAVQEFAVLRIFKGRAPKTVELVVNDDPADTGRLHLLMLDPTAAPAEPVATGTPWPLAESPVPGSESPLPDAESPWPGETLSPEPIPALAAADGPGELLAVSYTYNGEPTMVREFAVGTDPDTVNLRIP